MQSHQQQYAYGSINYQHQTSSNVEPNARGPKKKRNLPGMPDPDADVVALSPRTLMATNRFVCEICNKGFQRDQNLQLHRRGHDLPWKLKQRTSSTETRKRVYICPETSCVHHHPSRALGDLTGIKKHFYRKHGEKKWKCDKCSKKYAVISDWKAHYKTCGTREYRCDCGILFSRRDSFITHRAFCDALAEESAKYCASNMPTIETSSLNSNLRNSLFRPSETIVLPGGPNIFERKSGKTDAQAFPGCWDNIHAIADAGCCRADGHRLPVPDGQRDGIFQGNGYISDLQLSAMEQQIYPSKDGGPTISLTYYGTDPHKGEGEALSSHFKLEKFHSSLTREFVPYVNGSKDSELITAPITLASKIYFPETQTFSQLNPNGLNLLNKHEHLDFINESRIQMNPINNSEGFPLNFPADKGLPPIGSRANGGNQSCSYIRSPSIQPSRSTHSSATALLQKAAQMGARISNSDLFKAFDADQETGTDVSGSVLESAPNRRTPFNEKSGKEHSASTLYSSHEMLFSTRCTGDTPFKSKDLHNSWRLPEERIRTSTYCKALPEIPEYGVWKHLNRCTKTVNETYGNLEKDANAKEINCGVNGFICEESQLATFQDDSGHDPFTRDFLGVTRRASGMTNTAVSVGLSSFNQDSIARNDCQTLASVNLSNIGNQQVYTLQ